MIIKVFCGFPPSDFPSSLHLVVGRVLLKPIIIRQRYLGAHSLKVATVQDLSAVAEIEVLGSQCARRDDNDMITISHVLGYRCRILNTPRTALIDILRNTLCTLSVRMTSDDRLLNVIVLSQVLSAQL